jgi:hypothetical protein
LSNPFISFKNIRITPKDLHTSATDVKVYRFKNAFIRNKNGWPLQHEWLLILM